MTSRSDPPQLVQVTQEYLDQIRLVPLEDKPSLLMIWLLGGLSGAIMGALITLLVIWMI
ncbi:MAG TPA: hypothetical protein VLA89_04345 [Gemmatimonadales bacterium]|nr:hypothetical protein [Gemmatimonadales bacterium]